MMTEKPEEPYRYFAFISYSSEDEAFARTLQRKIEGYRLPPIIRKEVSKRNHRKCPKRLRPVFWDRTDLPAGMLDKNISKELESSKYLIVICSPNAAKSKWVNYETEEFIRLGRYERIIPYIVGGVPNSKDPSTEAFPPILRNPREYIDYEKYSREKNEARHSELHKLLDGIGELKGVSIQNEGEERSLIKIIAGMLQIDFAEVYPPERHTGSRTVMSAVLLFAIVDLIIMSVAFLKEKYLLSAVTVLLTAALVFVWNKYFRTHVRYYADYVERYGVPRGVIPLHKRQIHKRAFTWRIKTRNGRVLEADCIGSNGQLKDIDGYFNADRYAHTEFTYTASRSKLYQKAECYNRSKDLVLTRTVSNILEESNGVNYMVSFKKPVIAAGKKDNSDDNPIRSDDSDFDFLRGFREMESVEISPVSMVRKKLSRSYSGVNLHESSGVSGYRIYCDTDGLEIFRFYKDSQNNDAQDTDGTYGRSYAYNDQGRLERVACVWKQDELRSVDNIAGYSSVNYSYDSRGLCVLIACKNVDGQPALSEFGFASTRSEYDSLGNEIKREYFDTDGKPCLIDDGCAGYRSEYDSRGDEIKREYFGTDGKLCLIKDGYAGWRSEYDILGNEIKREFFGADGELCLTGHGYAVCRREYDFRGNEIKREYFGTDGKAIQK